jgi:hypothetical protein
MVAERLREKAAEYDLNARALADQPDAASRRSADVFAAVALVLYELATIADKDELREAA